MCAFIVPKRQRTSPILRSSPSTSQAGFAKFQVAGAHRAVRELPMTASGKVSKPKDARTHRRQAPERSSGRAGERSCDGTLLTGCGKAVSEAMTTVSNRA